MKEKDKCCKDDGKEDCCCGHDHEEVNVEDIVYNNDALLNVLIGLLIKKKVITEAEFKKEIEKLDMDADKE